MTKVKTWGGYKPPYNKNFQGVKNGNIFHYNEINKKGESENAYGYLIPGDIHKSFFPSEAISDGVDPSISTNTTNVLLCCTDEDWNMSFVNYDVYNPTLTPSETFTVCGFASYDTIFLPDDTPLCNIGHESPLSANCRIPSFFTDRGSLGTAHNSGGFIHNQNYKNFIIDIFNKFKNGEIEGDSITIPAIIINGIYQNNVSMRFLAKEEIRVSQDPPIYAKVPRLQIYTDSGGGGISFMMYKGDLYIYAGAG